MSGSHSNSNLYYIDLATDASHVKTYPIQSFIGDVSGEVKISALDGITPGIILTRNHVHRIVLLDSAEPKALTDSIPDKASVLTMDKFNEKILLHTSEKDSSVCRIFNLFFNTEINILFLSKGYSVRYIFRT